MSAVASTGELAAFSSLLFRNNMSVSLAAFALGMTFGIGTAWLLWYNGILMGVLAAVFLQALARAAGLTIHVRLIEGKDSQHVLSAIFKALGVALAQASSA